MNDQRLDRSKIALSFDVEDLFNIRPDNSHAPLPHEMKRFSDHREGLFDCMSKPFFDVLQLLESKGVVATFFLVADILERYPTIAKALKYSPHEIACHSLHHSIPVNPVSGEQLQSLREWEEELKTSKNILESYFGRPVLGYRAPAGYFCSWMIDILLRNGFKYDSSVTSNILYNKLNVKNSDTLTSPYVIDPETLGSASTNSGLVELPWSTLNIFGLRFPAGGACFYRLFGNLYFSMALKQCMSHGDTMIYMHILDFSEEPFLSQRHWKRRIYWMRKGVKVLKRFARLIELFEGRMTTCFNIYEKFGVSTGSGNFLMKTMIEGVSPA